LAFALLLALASPVEARKAQVFQYPLSVVWNAAVRLMRVDLQSPIAEKDRQDGYFLFDYPNGAKSVPGSVEVVEVNGGVRVTVQVPSLPSYVERMMLDKLARKLRKEFGKPVVKPVAAPEKSDEGDEGDDNSENSGSGADDAPDRQSASESEASG